MKISSFCLGDGPSSLPMGDNMDTGILNFKIYYIVIWLEACLSQKGLTNKAAIKEGRPEKVGVLHQPAGSSPKN